MRIGLIDIDSHNFPNLPLMKISAYHKSKGDFVTWCNALESYLNPYDIVYKSKVFNYTNDVTEHIRCEKLVEGGTGYDVKNKLPEVIENAYPDYSLYGIKNQAYGFLTRGCPRNCGFCIVSCKEGKQSKHVAELSQFWNGQKEIILLDPNILACTDRIKLLKELSESKAYVDFTQGLDARFLDDESIYWLNKIKVKMIHFAWDGVKDEHKILHKLEYFKNNTKLDRRKRRVYVLTNYDTTIDYDLYRVYKLKEMDYDPYIMIYNKDTAPKALRILQRQVNNKIIWNSGTIDTEESIRRIIFALQ